MEDTMILVEELKEAWESLAFEAAKNKKIKLDMFESAFSKTYVLVSKCAAEDRVDKALVELIARAFLFANIKDETMDSICQAAFVLTERMLSHCAFRKAAEEAGPVAVYVFEARRDVLLDFANVSESINKLTRIFENVYWKKVKA